MPFLNLYCTRVTQVRTGGLDGQQSPLIFAKLHLLPIDNYSEKKKVARKIQATSITLFLNSSCNTENYFSLIFYLLYWICFIFYGNIFIFCHYHFNKEL